MLLDTTSRAGIFQQPDAGEFGAGRRRTLTLLVLAALFLVVIGIHYFVPLSLNVAVTRKLQTFTAPGLHELMRLISGFGNAPKVVAITVIALLACNKRSAAFFLTFSGLGGWFITMQLKQFFASPRPTEDLVNVFHQWPTGSFPSGHLVFYVCYFGFLYFIARERLAPKSLFRRLVLITLALLIGLVGLSRLYLGEHWLSDLPGSYFLGFVWLLVSVKFYRFWTSARERQRRVAVGVWSYR
jgi:membrane-associated phospholipid phosphatase